MSNSTTTPTSVETLLEAWERLGPMERSVLNTLAWRLYAGQRKFGKLHETKRVWNWEAAEECLDSSVYLAAGLVALTEASKRRYFSSLDEGNNTYVTHVDQDVEYKEFWGGLDVEDVIDADDEVCGAV